MNIPKILLRVLKEWGKHFKNLNVFKIICLNIIIYNNIDQILNQLISNYKICLSIYL